MVQRGQNMGFTHEAGQAVGVAGDIVGKNLDRDLAAACRASGP
jgi:hypothetical protein